MNKTSSLNEKKRGTEQGIEDHVPVFIPLPHNERGASVDTLEMRSLIRNHTLQRTMVQSSNIPIVLHVSPNLTCFTNCNIRHYTDDEISKAGTSVSQNER